MGFEQSHASFTLSTAMLSRRSALSNAWLSAPGTMSGVQSLKSRASFLPVNCWQALAKLSLRKMVSGGMAYSPSNRTDKAPRLPEWHLPCAPPESASLFFHYIGISGVAIYGIVRCEVAWSDSGTQACIGPFPSRETIDLLLASILSTSKNLLGQICPCCAQ